MLSLLCFANLKPLSSSDLLDCQTRNIYFRTTRLESIKLNSLMAFILKNYRRLLYERPFITNVLTSATFMTGGDLISQSILRHDTPLDLHQTARFATAGIIFVGPAVRGCLLLIDRLFGPTRSLQVMVRKVIFDQGILAPIFTAANLSVLTGLKTHSVEGIKEELERSYVDFLKMNYKFWPMVSMINFYLVPLTYRVVFGSSAALLWNVAVSYRISTRESPLSFWKHHRSDHGEDVESKKSL